jgi:hypothetical protein
LFTVAWSLILNKDRLIGHKPPLKLREVWTVRTRLQMAGDARKFALFNLAIDSKLRGCDVVRLMVRAVQRLLGHTKIESSSGERASKLALWGTLSSDTMIVMMMASRPSLKASSLLDPGAYRGSGLIEACAARRPADI